MGSVFIAFAVLVMMANALNKYGMISWISEKIVGYVGHFDWLTVFLLLVLVAPPKSCNGI